MSLLLRVSISSMDVISCPGIIPQARRASCTLGLSYQNNFIGKGIKLAWLLQALKQNPGLAPKELKLNANYITPFGQTALKEALDMVYEMSTKEIVIVF